MKFGDLVAFPGVGAKQDIGMVVEIYEHTGLGRWVSELLVDVLWPDGDLIHGYLASDFEVINES